MKVRWYVALAVVLGFYLRFCLSQTRVDLGRQGKNVDFSGAEKSKPFRSGAALPASCETGEAFLQTGEGTEQTLYVCPTPNNWVAVGKELPSDGKGPGKALLAGDSGLQWAEAAGDVSGRFTELSVRALRGRPVSDTAPSDREVLRWNAALGRWEPASGAGDYQAGGGVLIAGTSIAVDAATVPNYYLGTGNPSGDCAPGREYYLDTAGGQLYYCAAANSWQAVSKREHSHSWGSLTGNLTDQTDLVAALNGKADLSHGHAVAGDLTGTVNAATVVKIQGRPVAASAPTDGAALVWNGTSQQWEPGTVSGSGAGFDALDTQVLWLREEFCSGGGSSGTVGALGWAYTTAGTGDTLTLSYGSSAHPCELKGIGVTSTAANDYRSLYLANPMGVLHSGGRTVPWKAVFIFMPKGAATELRMRVGFGGYAPALVPTEFIGVRLDHDANWDGSSA
ncbi:MAG: hypothetical protein ACPL7K_00245, partial [Armatimonadota bacterium]